MAHYAYLDEDNIVVDVIVGKDENELIDGLTPEIYYAQGTSYTVVRTSYNNKIRKQYAGIGYRYDADADVFIRPQPYSSWILDDNYDWQAPKPFPSEPGFWVWSEEVGDWVDEEVTVA
jgi:hypothetical protein